MIGSVAADGTDRSPTQLKHTEKSFSHPRHLAPGTWHLAPGTWHLTPDTWLILVVVPLVGSVDGDADVVGLVLGELGQLRAEMIQMETGHLLVEVLR